MVAVEPLSAVELDGWRVVSFDVTFSVVLEVGLSVVSLDVVLSVGLSVGLFVGLLVGWSVGPFVGGLEVGLPVVGGDGVDDRFNICQIGISRSASSTNLKLVPFVCEFLT